MTSPTCWKFRNWSGDLPSRPLAQLIDELVANSDKLRNSQSAATVGEAANPHTVTMLVQLKIVNPEG